jgi:hypothetical protein
MAKEAGATMPTSPPRPQRGGDERSDSADMAHMYFEMTDQLIYCHSERKRGIFLDLKIRSAL